MMKRASASSSPLSIQSNKRVNNQPNNFKGETDFLFRSPFQPEEQAKILKSCLDGVHRDLESIQSHGLEEFTKRRASAEEDESVQAVDKTAEEDNLGAVFEGSLRDYQIFMLERAKKENIIAHLGTGMGKTLIGIMLMKEFLPQIKEEQKKILFLVPSIALAVQHTDSIKANLPRCRVETACHTGSNSARARDDIAVADVVVATHGAAMDLLTHYPEVVSLDKVSLMVMDECHYATGNHNYATLLQKFHHSLPRDERPRILGLTASPLINMSIRTNHEQLQSLLSDFESMMDAKLVGFPSGSSSRSDVDQAVMNHTSSKIISLPDSNSWKLHYLREKEIKQLQILCNEVGPRVTSYYASTLAREVSRNEFEQETSQQCEHLRAYLLHVANYLNQCIDDGKAGLDGHTDKMRKLEKLLETVLTVDDPSLQQSPVGIVFVEMRITAIALSNYFCQKNREEILSRNIHESYDDDSENFRSTNNDGTNCASHFTPDFPLIRCDVAVRKATHIFKYLSNKKMLDEQKQKELEEDWLHQTTRIRTIIRKLRNRETNVLFATSIVEEGVDVEACSFVISFDAIKTIKSYIQMRGRARQKCAKFYAFSSTNNNSQPLSLDDALTVEKNVHRFIANREEKYIREFSLSPDNFTACQLECAEETAMHAAEYKTYMSSVDLTTSKSLLNRYALSVPIDPSCRTSKQAILLHMPVYKDHTLTLPTHIPPDMRMISLPQIFHSESRKKKQSLLALAAVVRLHKLGLLNDRLLPLSDTDMKAWLIDHALDELPPCKVLRSSAFGSHPYKVYLYELVQRGDGFCKEETTLSGDKGGMRLALVLPKRLPENIPSISCDHREFGLIECNFSFLDIVQLSNREWEILTDFHCVLFNARWRRKSKSNWFKFDDKLLLDHQSPYIVACINDKKKLDWDYIETILDEFTRPLDVRKKAVQDYRNQLAMPRICCPEYNPNTLYIIYGFSEKTCKDEFATSDYTSFKAYYADKYCLKVNPDGKLYRARRLWEFPQSSFGTVTSRSPQTSFVDIPQELTIESNVADPLLLLHSIILPQILYKLEQYLQSIAFVQHALHNYPILGKCISSIPIESVSEALTAKSCSEPTSYDRLEWLGDAVLKLIHTDALLKWNRTSYLHEGYLSLLRSAMGCNDRLHDCAKITGISTFILLTPLSRGDWMPCGLYLINEKNEVRNASTQILSPSSKVCADVVESLLGLIYLHCGMSYAVSVARELGLSISQGDTNGRDNREWCEMTVDSTLVEFATSFLGVKEFRRPLLLVEATTHQSCLHKPVPSYQRLEWIGDAVLCLAIREWLYQYDAKLPVPKLVVLETTLECNETLAFLGLKEGLCQFIDHRDSRLPNRFETFQRELETMGRGLWSTDPPKVIPDVVEALIGASHVDLGFEEGQKAALHVLHPIIKSILNPSLSLQGILHPKQHLYEMTSGIIRVRAYKSERFHRLGIASLSSESMNWKDGFVGVVSCKKVIIAAVRESSSRAAINVVCSLAVELLTSNPSILKKLHDIHLISTR